MLKYIIYSKLDLLVDLTGYMRHFGMTGLSCQTYAATAVGW